MPIVVNVMYAGRVIEMAEAGELYGTEAPVHRGTSELRAAPGRVAQREAWCDRRASAGPRAPAARVARSTPLRMARRTLQGRIPAVDSWRTSTTPPAGNPNRVHREAAVAQHKLVPNRQRTGTIGETLVEVKDLQVYFPFPPIIFQRKVADVKAVRWRFVRRQARRNAWPRGRVAVRQEHQRARPSFHIIRPTAARFDSRRHRPDADKGREVAVDSAARCKLISRPLCEP